MKHVKELVERWSEEYKKYAGDRFRFYTAMKVQSITEDVDEIWMAICASYDRALLLAQAIEKDEEKCQANPTAVPPQDCCFPFCDCFPIATKAVETLKEFNSQ